jgi:hypothetical protein
MQRHQQTAAYSSHKQPPPENSPSGFPRNYLREDLDLQSSFLLLFNLDVAMHLQGNYTAIACRLLCKASSGEQGIDLLSTFCPSKTNGASSRLSYNPSSNPAATPWAIHHSNFAPQLRHHLLALYLPYRWAASSPVPTQHLWLEVEESEYRAHAQVCWKCRLNYAAVRLLLHYTSTEMEETVCLL